MLFRKATTPGIGGAIIGLVEGAILCVGGLVFWKALEWTLPNWGNIPYFVTVILLGGGVLALGRGLTGRIGGAVTGCVLGAFVGLPFALLLPTSWDIPIPEKRSARSTIFELAGPGLDGKRIDIADYRGKLVLVDFWASWCSPCIRDLPNVQAAYKAYHDQGFEVIGVSIDRERQDLLDFLKKNQLPWPQIFYDPDQTGGVNPLVRNLDIKGIPATYLIGPEGNVLTINLHGPDLFLEVGRHLDPQTNGPPKFMMKNQAGVIPIRIYIAVSVALLLGALLGSLVERRMSAQPG